MKNKLIIIFLLLIYPLIGYSQQKGNHNSILCEPKIEIVVSPAMVKLGNFIKGVQEVNLYYEIIFYIKTSYTDKNNRINLKKTGSEILKNNINLTTTWTVEGADKTDFSEVYNYKPKSLSGMQVRVKATKLKVPTTAEHGKIDFAQYLQATLK